MDLTKLKLVGARGIMIAVVGTFLPILIAGGVALLLGYRGVAAIAAGCTFAPTSLGIAMNVLRASNIVNTPVGQLIVAAAIIDDMIARKLRVYIYRRISTYTKPPSANNNPALISLSGDPVPARSFDWRVNAR